MPAPYLSAYPATPPISLTFCHSVPLPLMFPLPCVFVSVISSISFLHTEEATKTHALHPMPQSCTNTPTQSVSLFLPFSTFSFLSSSLNYTDVECFLPAVVSGQSIYHPRKDGGSGGGRAPHALLCRRTLIPLGWKDASRLGIKPWPSARQQASAAPSLHHQIWATSMWASSRQLFCWYLICCLFLRACCRCAEKDVGEEIEGRNMPVSEIPAEA